MQKPRRTKIIATLGPATSDAAVLRNLIEAGVDMVRLNFSHGTAETHCRLANLVRDIAEECQTEIAILADLQGPKIRIAGFKENEVHLDEGDDFTLDTECPLDAGEKARVGLTYKTLINDVKAGNTLLLDDGRIVLSVNAVTDTQIQCTVETGGLLKNNKGINLLGGGLSAPALTEKDRQDLKIALECESDYIAISFPRHAEDMNQARELIEAAGQSARLVAKIERHEAVANIEEIIQASDVVMVARGDLAVEIGEEKVPGVQKDIIHLARASDKAVITATQMMESMIQSNVPTRAEVSDVANAVLDGSDAVMLSAETATGVHPVKVVETMVKICRGAEEHPRTRYSRHRLESQFSRPDETIAMAAMYTANHLNIKAIISLTETGSTPLWMSRIRSGIPIYGLSRHLKSLRRMKLFRGVFPIAFDPTEHPRYEINRHAIETLKQQELIDDNDYVIITKGSYMGEIGGTNTMQIIRVGDHQN
jgi:pyruvate kinase